MKPIHGEQNIKDEGLLTFLLSLDGQDIWVREKDSVGDELTLYVFWGPAKEDGLNLDVDVFGRGLMFLDGYSQVTPAVMEWVTAYVNLES